MTQSMLRPHCMQCRQMFTDEDVAIGNYRPVHFDMKRGPDFVHLECPGKKP